MKHKHIFTIVSAMLLCVACNTLFQTGKIIARPALTILVQQLVSDSAEWGTVVRIVNSILDEALSSSPPPSTEEIEQSIERLLGEYKPGTVEQRNYFLAEVSAALAEGNMMSASIKSDYPSGILILKKSIDKGLGNAP